MQLGVIPYVAWDTCRPEALASGDDLLGDLRHCSTGIACHNSAPMIDSSSATLHPKFSMWCLLLQALAAVILPCTLMLGCIFVACQCKQDGPREPFDSARASVSDLTATLAGLAAVLLTLGCIALLPTSRDEYVPRRDNSSHITAEETSESAGTPRRTGVLGASVQLRSSGRPTSTIVEPSDSTPDDVPPAGPADSSLEDISRAADTVGSGHILGSAVQHDELLVKLWTLTPAEAAAVAVLTPQSIAYVPALETLSSVPLLDPIVKQNESMVKLWTRKPGEAAAAAVLSPLSLAYVPTLETLSSVPLLDLIVQHDELVRKLWARTPEEAAAAAVLSPQSMAHVPTLGALSSLPLLDPAVQLIDDSVAEQPLQGPDSTGEQAASNVDSIGTPTQRQSGIKARTLRRVSSAFESLKIKRSTTPTRGNGAVVEVEAAAGRPARATGSDGGARRGGARGRRRSAVGNNLIPAIFRRGCFG